MVRISDVLKQEGQFPESEPPKTPAEQKEESQESSEKIEKKMVEESQTNKTIPQLQISPEDPAKIYTNAVGIIKDILDKVKSDTHIDLRRTYEIVEIMADYIILGNKGLLSYITNYSEEDNYLYTHSVNVCILAMEVAFGLGYNRSRLLELGLGALLHDIGMTKVIDIANQPRPLNEHEFAEIKKHPIYSADILTKIKGIEKGVIAISEQTHERLNGKGYPKGIKNDYIHEYAKITAVVDIYEALIHPRSFRKAISSREALKELLNISSSGGLDHSIIKLLIDRIGLYPVGSWVELNTGEIGKVISLNKNSPLRPKINMIFNANKERLNQIKLIDLSQCTDIFIKCNINPQDLTLNLEG